MFYEQVKESADYLKKHMQGVVDTGIVLGSGLGSLVDEMSEKIIIPYNEIPHFPKSKLEGHAGNLVFGVLQGRHVVAMQGRFHYYEGFTMKEVTYPIYVMKLLGVKELIVTNACGGINRSFQPGDLMIIEDFINSVCVNPLIGDNDERFGPRFPDMSEPYANRLRALAKEVAQELEIPFQEGVYTFFQGPYYETAAEIRFYAKGGSDAIGMSTVPETIVANYLGIEVLGIACITNMATGICKEKHSHAEVLETANRASDRLCKWIKGILKQLS
ncbi:MAG: purine-nucleoside phosphorylase [Longicatena sp.]